MKGLMVSSWSTCHMLCRIPSSPSKGPCVGVEPPELAEDLTDVTANNQSHKQTKGAYEWLRSGHPVFEPFQLGPQVQEVETGCVFASENP